MATILEKRPPDVAAPPLEEKERARGTAAPPRSAFSGLKGHKYITLTTFRKSGEVVSTPVWFVAIQGRLYVTTSQDSGKAKRIRNNPWVLVAPSTPMGKAVGPTVEAVARILPPSEQAQAARALGHKYGWLLRAFDFVMRIGGHQHTYLEIEPL